MNNTNDDALRSRILKGGFFLVVRQGIGVILGTGGLLLVTRIIGPREYGLYTVAMSFVVFLSMMGTRGIDVYLIRMHTHPTKLEFDQAFTFLLGVSVILSVSTTILSYTIAAFIRTPEVAILIKFQALSIPFSLVALPAIVKLDRNLNFKQVAINEVSSQACMYAISVPLAFVGVGAWAPASGWLAQQVCLMILSFRSARYHPSLCWDATLLKKMLKYGLSYSSSIWVWQLRSLVNPVLVGRLVGAEAVGYVALSIRFVEVLSFAKGATWRIAMAGLSKISNDDVRLRRVVSEGMKLQAVAVGVPLSVFALVSPILVPFGFGHAWTPALVVFPFIAISYLTNALFNLHSSVLYLRQKNFGVTVFHAIHVTLFAGSAALLLPHLGSIGYGLAELVALLSYLVIHMFLTHQIESPSYTACSIWFLTTLCSLGTSLLNPPVRYLGVPVLFIPLLFSKERENLAGYARIFFSRSS